MTLTSWLSKLNKTITDTNVLVQLSSTDIDKRIKHLLPPTAAVSSYEDLVNTVYQSNNKGKTPSSNIKIKGRWVKGTPGSIDTGHDTHHNIIVKVTKTTATYSQQQNSLVNPTAKTAIKLIQTLQKRGNCLGILFPSFIQLFDTHSDDEIDYADDECEG